MLNYNVLLYDGDAGKGEAVKTGDGRLSRPTNLTGSRQESKVQKRTDNAQNKRSGKDWNVRHLRY